MPILSTASRQIGRAAVALAGILAFPTVAAAQSAGDIAIHGYLTQGWGATSGPQFYGIGKEGTTDLRTAALQFRYDRDENGFVVQVNHRRLGASAITDYESSVNLNWAFYERSIGDATKVKVGRIPIPRGIYNEQRSIGVLLPTYRPPVVFYDEGAYYSETIDGLVASHTFRDGHAWSVDLNAYGGGWSTLAYDQSGDVYSVSRIRAENAYGAQLWLNTPVDGVRLGFASQHYRWRPIGEANAQAGDPANVTELHASLDATRSYGFLRAEAQQQDFSADVFQSAYAQLGIRPVSRLLLVGEMQQARETQQTYAPDWPVDFTWHRSVGAGVNYSLSPALVLKVEHHWDRGIQVEQTADPRDPPKFRYLIASVSASF